MIQIKRIYDPAEPEDGFRVLCTKRWPRGVRKSDVPNWWPELGTPDELLRPWLDGAIEPAVFREAMREALSAPAAQDRLADLAERVSRGDPVTLLTSVKDLSQTHLTVVRELVAERAGQRGEQP